MTATAEKSAQAQGFAFISLADIVANTAQSRGMGVLSNLQALGYGLFEKISAEAGLRPIWELLTSDKPEEKAQGAALLEQHEEGLVRFAAGLAGPMGQLEPIGVMTVKDGNDVIYGMRRAIAAAYNWAKGIGDGTIEAKVFEVKLSPVELKLMALKENDDREQQSPIDKAMSYAWFVKEAKLTPKQIGDKIGLSDQHVRNYLKLLSKELADKRLAIHNGDMPVDRALKLYATRKNTATAAADNAGEASSQAPAKEGSRYRMPGVKALTKLYATKKKPKKMEQKEWELWLPDDVRKLMAYKLGFKFTPFRGEVLTVEPKPRAAAKPSANGTATKKAKVLKVTRKRAQALLISLGKTQAGVWADKTLQEKLQNIPNILEEGQKAETDSLQKLLDTLVAGYKDGVRVEITA